MNNDEYLDKLLEDYEEDKKPFELIDLVEYSLIVLGVVAIVSLICLVN